MTARAKALSLTATLLTGCRRPAEPAAAETRTLRILLATEPSSLRWDPPVNGVVDVLETSFVPAPFGAGR